MLYFYESKFQNKQNKMFNYNLFCYYFSNVFRVFEMSFEVLIKDEALVVFLIFIIFSVLIIIFMILLF